MRPRLSSLQDRLGPATRPGVGLDRSPSTNFSGAGEAVLGPRRWAITGAVLGLMAGTLLFAPAQWLAGALSSATGSRILLTDARGTIWNGNAVAVLTGGADSREARTLPGRMNWQLRPRWTGALLTLQQDCCLPHGIDLAMLPGWNRVRVDVQPRTAPPEGLAAAGPTAMSLGGAWAQWPAELLSGLGTPWNTMELGGAMRLSSQGLALNWVDSRISIEGSADLELQDLRSRLSTLPRLGTYRFGVTGVGNQAGTAQVSLTTVDGALQLSAQGTWSASGLRLRGEASAAPADQGALTNLLNIIGRRDGNRSILSIG